MSGNLANFGIIEGAASIEGSGLTMRIAFRAACSAQAGRPEEPSGASSELAIAGPASSAETASTRAPIANAAEIRLAAYSSVEVVLPRMLTLASPEGPFVEMLGGVGHPVLVNYRTGPRRPHPWTGRPRCPARPEDGITVQAYRADQPERYNQQRRDARADAERKSSTAGLVVGFTIMSERHTSGTPPSGRIEDHAATMMRRAWSMFNHAIDCRRAASPGR